MIPQIKLENACKIYRKDTDAQVRALNEINLEIQSGECVAVVGRSGSGKSTLLHILGCVDFLTEGTYILEGKDIRISNQRQQANIRNQKIGFVLQEFGLLLNKSSYENVAVPLYFNHKIKQKQIPDIVKNALGLVNLEDKIKQNTGELSGGQKQRVAIARALVNNPEIILADEPTGALDNKTSEEIMDILLDLNKQGKTVIIITHDLSIAKKCNRMVELDDGFIINDTKGNSI